MNVRRLFAAMLGLCILNAPLLADYGGAPEDPPPVNIYETSMRDYVNIADCNMLMKVYSSAYVDALEKECDRLVKRVIEKTAPSKDLPRDVKKAHEAMKGFATNMGQMSESLLWWDFQSKENMMGTGYGYEIMAFQANIFWRSIVYYQSILGNDQHRFFHNLSRPLPNKEIGGIAPERMLKVLKAASELQALKARRSKLFKAIENKLD
mgnify:CR=1 FL=1